MELRKYQENVLKDLATFLDKMLEKKKEQDEYNKFLESKNDPLKFKNFFREAWEEIFKDGYAHREDGRGQAIPNVCLKVPTGGGKTLLAAHAVKIINQYYFRRNTGLILWVTPSEAIYSQTRRAFKDPDHPYRQILDMAAPSRRAKILERHDRFSPSDVLNGLSVMLLMTQASARQNSETLRMFRDHGGYMDFFPSSNDYQKHQELLDKYPNLDYHEGHGETKNVKYSLGNVLKMLRPIIVLDEGHTAKSHTRREAFNQFNPRFILELSATPQEQSNVLVNVSGQTLKEEEMIKLPIQLKNTGNSDWRTTLSDSCERLNDITTQAQKYRSNGGKYIRPILLVRVENTGKDQQGKGTIHAEDVREYLTVEMGFTDDAVRVKSSEADEISKEDLLSPSCRVQVIITKDALKEGWDCPFAYVLALLDKTRSLTALTQMIGRVLRQPYAQQTNIHDLDTAHIFCFNQDVGKLVKEIQSSLNKHGFGDMKNEGVYSGDEEMQKILVNRREKFKDLNILMPQVLHVENNEPRLLSYERDILSKINWDELTCYQQSIFLEDTNAITEGWVSYSYDDTKTTRVAVEGEANNTFFARNISDLVPNPWQAMRIVKEARSFIDKQGSSQSIYNNRINIVRQIRSEIEEKKENLSKAVFCESLKSKKIQFCLDATNSAWKIPADIHFKCIGDPKYLTRKTNEQIELSFFEKYQERDFNEFEKKVACYLDESNALKWWHRVAARQEYGLQGWRKHLVYPDFLAFIGSNQSKPLILETKGTHLAGNEDTQYKQSLFDTLEANYTDAGSAILSGVGTKVMLRIISGGDNKDAKWKRELNEIINF